MNDPMLLIVLLFLLPLPSSSPEGLAVVCSKSWTRTGLGLPPCYEKEESNSGGREGKYIFQMRGCSNCIEILELE